MKILIQRNPLLQGLDTVKEAVPKQNALPILKGVKITADNQNLYLYASNLTMGIKTRIKEANVIEPGIAACEALKLLSIVKELPETEILLKTEDDHVKLECQEINFKLIGLNEQDFPQEVNPSEENSFLVGADFFSALSKVKHAASREESRYNLSAVYLSKEIVATDGHRMSIAKTQFPMENTLLPIDFITALMKWKQNDHTRISCSQNIFFVYSEDLLFHGRVLDGTYPDYGAVIPQSHQRTATMDSKRLFHALKRIMLMSDPSNHIRFNFNGDHVVLASESPEAGEGHERLELLDRPDSSEHEPLLIGFSARYLLDVLEVLQGDRVTFLMNGSDQPLKIEDNDSIHIVMPVKVA